MYGFHTFEFECFPARIEIEMRILQFARISHVETVAQILGKE